MNNTLMAVPSLFAQITRPMNRNTLFTNEFFWFYVAVILC